MTISSLSLLSLPVIMVWFYRDFFPEKSIGDIIVKVVFFFLIGFILYVALIFIFIIGTLIISGPEGLLKLAPQPK